MTEENKTEDKPKTSSKRSKKSDTPIKTVGDFLRARRG